MDKRQQKRALYAIDEMSGPEVIYHLVRLEIKGIITKVLSIPHFNFIGAACAWVLTSAGLLAFIVR